MAHQPPSVIKDTSKVTFVPSSATIIPPNVCSSINPPSMREFTYNTRLSTRTLPSITSTWLPPQEVNSFKSFQQPIDNHQSIFAPLPLINSTIPSQKAFINNSYFETSRRLSNTSNQQQQPHHHDSIKTSTIIKPKMNGIDYQQADLKWRVTETRMLSMQIDFGKGEFEINGIPLYLNLDHPTTPGETGLRVWDAGICMAKYFETHLEDIKNMRKVERLKILELGCGSGVVGISCSLTSTPCDVILTDRAIIKPRTESNIDINKEAIAKRGNTCCYTVIDWKDLDNSEYDWSSPPDIIIASDVLWSQVFVKPFVETLLKASPNHTNTPDFYICQKSRNVDLDALWINEVSKHFELLDECRSTEVLPEEYHHARINMYHFKRRLKDC